MILPFDLAISKAKSNMLLATPRRRADLGTYKFAIYPYPGPGALLPKTGGFTISCYQIGSQNSCIST